jgi:hypothetical protein
MRFVCFFVGLLVTFQFVLGQELNPIQEKTVRETIEETYGPININFVYNQGYNTTRVVNNDTLYNPNGYYYVFKLTNGKAKRLDGCTYHGGNFHRFLFDWDTHLYSLGGYGFFTTTNNLLYFNPINRGWTYKPTTGDFPRHLLGANFKHSHFVYTFNNYKCGNSTSKDEFDFRLYRLNLQKMHWQVFQLQDTSLFFKGFSYVLKDYVFFKGEDKSILIHPATMKYVVLKNEEIGFPYSRIIIGMNNNTLLLRHPDSTHVKDVKKLDLTNCWKSSTLHKGFDFIPIDKDPFHWNYMHTLLLSTFTCLVVFIYLLRKEKKKKQVSIHYSENHLKLMNHPSNILTQEEFDTLMQIDKLEQDSKKLKRHRIIADLNQTHPNFIERIKDETDKRRNLYKVKA